jgi:hypothetical protein
MTTAFARVALAVAMATLSTVSYADSAKRSSYFLPDCATKKSSGGCTGGAHRHNRPLDLTFDASANWQESSTTTPGPAPVPPTTKSLPLHGSITIDNEWRRNDQPKSQISVRINLDDGYYVRLTGEFNPVADPSSPPETGIAFGRRLIDRGPLRVDADVGLYDRLTGGPASVGREGGLLSSVHARYELDPTTRLFGGVTLKTNSDSSPYKFTLRQGIEKDLGGITLAPWLQEELTTNQPDYTAGIKFEVPVYGSKVFLGLSKHISGPKINNDRITLGLTKLF